MICNSQINDGYYPIHLAAQSGQLEVLTYFATTKGGFGKHSFDISPERHTETPKPTYSKQTPLYLVARSYRLECVDYLISQLINRNDAVQSAHLPEIAEILVKGFNNDIVDKELEQSIMDISKQAAALAPKIKTLDELRQLNKSLWCVDNVLGASNNQKEQAITELNNAIQDCLTIKGSKWKQFIGALCVFAGVAIMAAGVFLAPPVAAVLAGGLLAVGGATLFAQGRNRSMKSSLEAFAKNESHTLKPK